MSKATELNAKVKALMLEYQEFGINVKQVNIERVVEVKGWEYDLCDTFSHILPPALPEFACRLDVNVIFEDAKI